MDTSKPTNIPMNTKAPSCADNDGHFFQNQNLRQHGQQKTQETSKKKEY